MTIIPHRHAIPDDILALSHERDMLRRRGQYARADALKRQIEEAGFAVKDNPRGAHLVILPSIEVDGETYRTARYLPSLLDESDSCQFSLNVLAHNRFAQTQRCIESILRCAGDHEIEIVLVDNASRDELGAWSQSLRQQEPRLRSLHITRKMGTAEARNIGLMQSRGHTIVLLDTSVELTGDIFTPLARTLADDTIGITGLHGLRTPDLRHFEESSQLQVEAVNGLCLAFRRKLLQTVGLFDEKYRFHAYMDIDFSFAARACAVQAVVTPDLPVIVYPLEQDESLPAVEQARLTKRNFYHFLEKWGSRDDLLLED